MARYNKKLKENTSSPRVKVKKNMSLKSMILLNIYLTLGLYIIEFKKYIWNVVISWFGS